MCAPVAPLLGRIRSSALLLGCVTVIAFVAAALAAALASFGQQALPQAAHRQLARSPGASAVVIGLLNGAGPQADTQAIRRAMNVALAPARWRLDSAVWTGPLTLTGPGRPAGQPVEAAAPAQIQTYATVTAGNWPGAPRAGQPIPAALPASAAARLRVVPGTVLAVRDTGTRRLVRLRVTGLYRQRDPAGRYWGLDRIWTCGASTTGCFASRGPIVVSPAAFGRGRLGAGQASWVVLPDTASIPVGGLASLASRVEAASARLQAPALGLVVTTGLPAAARATAAGLAASRSLLAIGGLELLLPAGAALALAAGLLASHRDGEAALLGARGAARWQLALPALAEAVLAGAVAAGAGVLAGGELAGQLARSGPLRGTGLRVAGYPAASWLAELGVLVLCAVVMLWPELRRRRPGAVRGRPAALAPAATAGADLLLLGLAAAACWELHTAAATGRPLTGASPVLAAAPALTLAGVSLIPLRGLPPLARLLDRLTAASTGLSAPLASWQVSRRPLRQAGPVVLAVFAVATGTLALVQYQTWHAAALDQAAFTVGSDVRASLPAPLPPGRVATVSRAPGVTAAMAAAAQPTGTGGEVLAVTSRTAAATVALRPDLSPLPPAALWRRITLPPTGLALPGRPARLQIVASLRAAGRAGPAAVSVTLQDADGGVWTLPAGRLPADGRQHGLTAFISATRQAAYPVRLIGLAFGAPRHTAAGGGPRTVTISALAVGSTVTGRLSAPFAPGSALAAWRARTRSAAAVRRAGTTVLPLAGPVSLSAPPPAAVIPAIATRAFLSSRHIGVGTVLPVSIGSASVPVRVAAAVKRFPTVTGGAVVVDLAAVQSLLAHRGDTPLPVTGWWLRTAGAAVPPAVKAALPAGTAVTARLRQDAALLRDPLAAAPQQAALATAVAMAVLAALGLSVSVAASLRARRRESALLAALGIAPAAQAGQLCLEQLLLSLPAAATGAAAGAGLAELLVPVLTQQAGLAALPVRVVFPLAWTLVLAAAVAAVPVLAAALTVARRPRLAARLRTVGAQ